jgi:hypothetical protein
MEIMAHIKLTQKHKRAIIASLQAYQQKLIEMLDNSIEDTRPIYLELIEDNKESIQAIQEAKGDILIKFER